jgi:hypothetical protein
VPVSRSRHLYLFQVVDETHHIIVHANDAGDALYCAKKGYPGQISPRAEVTLVIHPQTYENLEIGTMLDLKQEKRQHKSLHGFAALSRIAQDNFYDILALIEELQTWTAKYWPNGDLYLLRAQELEQSRQSKADLEKRIAELATSVLILGQELGVEMPMISLCPVCDMPTINGRCLDIERHS